MERCITRYLRHHNAAGHSARTVKTYNQVLNGFLVFCTANDLPTELDKLHADHVRAWLEDGRARKLSDVTLNGWVRVVRAFSAWLVVEEWLDKDPFKRVKVPSIPDNPKAVLLPAEVDKLLAGCDRKTVTGARDYAIILLLFSTGLRAGELLALRPDDIDWKRGTVHVRKGKGNKYRAVPLGTKPERALEKYLRYAPPNVAALFVGKDGRPLAYQGLRQMLRRRGDAVGIHANPHKFRHSAAIQYLRAGGKLEVLQRVLGHSTLGMTLHYARQESGDLTAAHVHFDPTNALKAK